MATVPFTTKRAPALTGGKRGTPQPYLVADTLRCTPLDTADTQVARDMAVRLRQTLDSPIFLLQCFADADLDIIEGDVLVARGVEYTVRWADAWEYRGSVYLRLVLEKEAR